MSSFNCSFPHKHHFHLLFTIIAHGLRSNLMCNVQKNINLEILLVWPSLWSGETGIMVHGPTHKNLGEKKPVNGLVRLSKDPNPEVLKRRLLWLLCPKLTLCFSNFWALNSKEKHSSPLKSIFADKIMLGDNLIICWNVWKTTLVTWQDKIHRVPSD